MASPYPNPGPYNQQAYQQPEKKGCLARNWKWMLPVGCLGIIVAVVGVVLAIVLGVSSTIRSSEVFQQAIKKAESNSTVRDEMGTPIESGWMFSGNISVENDKGDAEFDIPISGPKKSGTLFVVAKMDKGQWTYTTLQVEIEGRSGKINLLP